MPGHHGCKIPETLLNNLLCHFPLSLLREEESLTVQAGLSSRHILKQPLFPCGFQLSGHCHLESLIVLMRGTATFKLIYLLVLRFQWGAKVSTFPFAWLRSRCISLLSQMLYYILWGKNATALVPSLWSEDVISAWSLFPPMGAEQLEFWKPMERLKSSRRVWRTQAMSPWKFSNCELNWNESRGWKCQWWSQTSLGFNILCPWSHLFKSMPCWPSPSKLSVTYMFTLYSARPLRTQNSLARHIWEVKYSKNRKKEISGFRCFLTVLGASPATPELCTCSVTVLYL